MARKGQRKGSTKESTEPPEAVENPDPTEKTSTPRGTKRKRFDWSNLDFGGFELKPAKTTKRPRSSGNGRANKKSKQLADADIVQDDVFDAGLSTTECRVSPSIAWESTTRYRRFTSMAPLHLESATH